MKVVQRGHRYRDTRKLLPKSDRYWLERMREGGLLKVLVPEECLARVK